MAVRRKVRKDSTAGRLKRESDKRELVQPPEGVDLSSDQAQVLWRQYTAARPPDSWREFDLLILAKMVSTEIKIREWQAELDASGPLIRNKRGTLIENPLLRAIDTLERRHLAMLRSISLGVRANQAISANESGQKNDPDARPPKNGVDPVVHLIAK